MINLYKLIYEVLLGIPKEYSGLFEIYLVCLSQHLRRQHKDLSEMKVNNNILRLESKTESLELRKFNKILEFVRAY
jgi:hypothetical protein